LTPPSQLKILIVDNSSTLRRILKKCLGKLHYEDIQEAGSRKEALEWLTPEKEINLIFMDWSQPENGGFELLEYIKKEENRHNIPVIIITTAREKKEIIKAVKMGADNYLIKPVTYEIVEEKIKAIFEE